MIDTDDTILFATSNPYKRREFESLLGEFLNPYWTIRDLKSWPNELPEIVEDRETFWGNAVKKACEASGLTHCVAISDDSGLEVDALNGRPGVYSARFAGKGATDEENNRKLVSMLEDVPEEERSARYVCVAAIALTQNAAGRALAQRTGVPIEEVGVAEPDKEATMVRLGERVVVWFRGTVEGRIIDQPRGSKGFGYDPHFYVPQWKKTMAEVSLEKKNSISHRAQALAKMAQFFSGHP